jgi:hypothetical protein
MACRRHGLLLRPPCDNGIDYIMLHMAINVGGTSILRNKLWQIQMSLAIAGRGHSSSDMFGG